MEQPQWAYLDYSAWARQLAATYSRADLEKMLRETERELERATASHLRAVSASTSMSSQSQRRAQARNRVTGVAERKRALKDALEILQHYPDKAKREE